MTALPATDSTTDIFNAVNGFHNNTSDGEAAGADSHIPSLHIQRDTTATNSNEQQQRQQGHTMNNTNNNSNNNNSGDAGFDVFFFHNLPPIGSEDEAAHTSAFEGFCFDDICGDGGWPTPAIVNNETSNDGNGATATDVTNIITDNHHNSAEIFDFLLANDKTGGNDPSTISASTSVPIAISTRVEVDQTISNFIGVELGGNPAIDPVPVFSPSASTNGIITATTTTAAASLEGEKHFTVTEAHERKTNTANSLQSTQNKITGNNLPQNNIHNIHNGHAVMCEDARSIQEPVKTIPASPISKSRLSLGVNDTSIVSNTGSAAGVSRVPREGVEELLRRAERILSDGANNETHTTADENSTAGYHGSSNPKNNNSNNNKSNNNNNNDNTNPDSFFTAQVSHWLRRGAEVQENALSTVAELQLSLTQTLRLFSAHSGVSSALGPKYAATPVALTLPLVMPMLQLLLEEE
ncbi:hypothetical protein LSM04_006117 [Trypanosoma melophagium]|uniref:uncharacterized protein n=1 Tax=Trypanosoma melophagium TaxID=715481 RepID=UPI003519F62D|nr:hypothetical protein LSM04_006117 [Trypanosoma melophagium]